MHLTCHLQLVLNYLSNFRFASVSNILFDICNREGWLQYLLNCSFADENMFCPKNLVIVNSNFDLKVAIYFHTCKSYIS